MPRDICSAELDVHVVPLNLVVLLDVRTFLCVGIGDPPRYKQSLIIPQSVRSER